MADRIIKVSKKSDSNELYLTDSEGNKGGTITTKVRPGDNVIWELDPDGGVDYIIGILKKPVSGSTNVLSSTPTPVDPNDPKTAWQGTVEESVTGSEIYDIAYMIEGQSYIGDPVIEVDEDGTEGD
ncbi:hypothetical protein [Marivirga lumbricoides]|nr:hypothetical protein C9994_09235 [Marivirga lumbricoides]